MAKKERPAFDFWITDLKSDILIVSRFTAAGFEAVPDEIVQLRLFIFYDFLQAHNLVTERLALVLADIRPDTSLWNRHLTNEGYYFLQRFLPRWQNRLYKHTTEAKERALLEKWYRQFIRDYSP